MAAESVLPEEEQEGQQEEGKKGLVEEVALEDDLVADND